ncbi:MAG: MoaD/ThiS family protein [Pseudomonadota bacterium]|uniref:MoaD/ThiS family protein n=1 Tax=unclassified Sphingobium TaxID=2611147 RepID=UPI001E420EFE|nr:MULTISPECIES: MoaD/ThiS family protein [unclassified Sphingobium]GLI97393.1 molybdopterin synthase sulfur carrier subunit [Sphingobium sp. BS19]CAH0353814.1 Molybdopterin synthase sulfur carrier subunit [Sphingobium sp. CECT 9361]
MAGLDILYFAWVRDGIGRDGERIDTPARDTSIAALIESLAARGGGYAQALGQPTRLRAALDQRFVPLDTVIGDARELALFPPVTGG